jgi:hypothetical protein
VHVYCRRTHQEGQEEGQEKEEKEEKVQVKSPWPWLFCICGFNSQLSGRLERNRRLVLVLTGAKANCLLILGSWLLDVATVRLEICQCWTRCQYSTQSKFAMNMRGPVLKTICARGIAHGLLRRPCAWCRRLFSRALRPNRFSWRECEC